GRPMTADRPPSDVSALVDVELRAFLTQEGKCPGRLSPRAVLTEELGLSSAEVAVLIARIGSRLGVVPPATSFTDVRAGGAIAALSPPAPRGSDDESLARSQRRAEARRQGRGA